MKEDILVTTDDGSNTLFSLKYNQHFHNTQDGAINEALNKHIIPAFTYHKDKKELNILDICYGIGYNTLVTIYYVYKNNLDIKLNIYSVELDFDLIKSLKNFTYPKEFEKFKNIINEISKNQKYEDQNIKIEVAILDARKYIRQLPKDFFDIVYQDAFSSDVNKELWTKEYFDDIYKICKKSAILTSYAIATSIRLSMYEAGFFIYEAKPKLKITLALKTKQNISAKYIDMELKKIRNPNAKSLYDI
ncbi:tRNA (5-methylaminomethyl-2-thiouridine)(34)-methyltransferase MnmD [Aliarcobacter vitoriensis]|uniref:tRNA (5-methylaminomethyl-2-thiouridine)(34)-methyltransferase MnmD n=1 Tax=Aliarcobacter vitoriensis TaxID=2011099 RepID=UPI003AAAE292